MLSASVCIVLYCMLCCLSRMQLCTYVFMDSQYNVENCTRLLVHIVITVYHRNAVIDPAVRSICFTVPYFVIGPFQFSSLTIISTEAGTKYHAAPHLALMLVATATYRSTSATSFKHPEDKCHGCNSFHSILTWGLHDIQASVCD